MDNNTGDRMPLSTQTAISVVLSLCIITVSAVVGIVVTIALHEQVPPSLAAIGGTAVGALGGHLGALGMMRKRVNGGNDKP